MSKRKIKKPINPPDSVTENEVRLSVKVVSLEKELKFYQEENMEIDAELDWLKDFVKESFYISGDGDIYYMFRGGTPHNEVYLRELLEDAQDE